MRGYDPTQKPKWMISPPEEQEEGWKQDARDALEESRCDSCGGITSKNVMEGLREEAGRFMGGALAESMYPACDC